MFFKLLIHRLHSLNLFVNDFSENFDLTINLLSEIHLKICDVISFILSHLKGLYYWIELF